MTTYRQIFSVAEFRALFAGNSASVAGKTIQMLALSALVYAATRSPLLAALAYLGGMLPQAIGAMTLLSLADRVRPRLFLAAWDLVRTVATVLLAAGVLPIWAMLALVMALGAVDSLAVAIRLAVLTEVLPGGYVLGRSVLNISTGAMQIIGFAIGGTVVATIGPRTALLVSAGLAGCCAIINRLGLRRREPRQTGRATLLATWRGNRTLFADPRVRRLLIALWIPNGLIVGAEAMYVPYAGGSAGVLFIASAGGMLLGDVVVGRWVPAGTRERLITPLQVLLAVPYLMFAAHPGTWLAAVLVTVASFGYAASLGLQQRLVDTVPEYLRGQALGLDSSGRMTFQGACASAVGTVAEAVGPAGAMVTAAVASLAVSALLWHGLRVRSGAGSEPDPVGSAAPA